MSPYLAKDHDRSELQAAVECFENLKGNVDLAFMRRRISALLSAVEHAVAVEAEAMMTTPGVVASWRDEMAGATSGLLYDIDNELEDQNSSDTIAETRGDYERDQRNG